MINCMSLNDIERIVKKLPVASNTAHKLIELCNDGKSTTRIISDVLSTDSALTSIVLRIANSAFYGIPHTVFNATDAVSILGSSTISAISSVSLVKQFTESAVKSETFNLNLFLEHCLKTACIARLIAHGYNVGPNKGFTIGLLHDIGGLILLMSGKDIYKQDMVSGIPCHLDHATAGAYLAKLWNFPEDIEIAIATHHSIGCCDLGLLANDACKLSMSIGLNDNSVITINNNFFSNDEIKLLLSKADEHYTTLKGLLGNDQS